MSAFRAFLTRPRLVVVALASTIAAADGATRPDSPFRVLNRIYAEAPAEERQKLVIVGGGSAGIGVASQVNKILKKDSAVKVEYVVIEPSDVHFYQPGWTLVGSGLYDAQATARPMASVMPKHVKWVQKAVSKFDPENNTVVTADGQSIKYDFLVVATGLQPDIPKVKGLQEALDDPNSSVATIYDYRYAPKAWELVKNMKDGKALFTMPAGAIKCGGAPAKMLFLSEDYWRRQGIRHDITVEYCPAGPTMFAVKKYGDSLEELRRNRKIIGSFGHELIAVDKDARQATFKVVGSGETVTKDYDMMHVALPFKAPDVVSASPLADPASGFVQVDKNTLQHTRYPNVFGIGDSANLPTSKTIAAITSQAPVVAWNLSTLVRARARGLPAPSLTASYNGYTSCPLLTGRGQLILAEFSYGGVPQETFGHVLDQSLPKWIFYKMKTDFFPYVYWNAYLDGNWYGPRGFFAPKFEDPLAKKA